MPTRIAEYYLELQRREGLVPVELVREWSSEDTESLTAAFRDGVAASGIIGQEIPIREGSSNQSIGNQVAEFLALSVVGHLGSYRLDPCPSGGYPDKVLVEVTSGRTFPFELKATSTWDEADSNRRVLTSSSKKLRQRFGGPVNHVLATVLYSKNVRPSVRSLRLDFIEPDTLVNIRLEASVSHRLLSEATHRTITFP